MKKLIILLLILMPPVNAVLISNGSESAVIFTDNKATIIDYSPTSYNITNTLTTILPMNKPPIQSKNYLPIGLGISITALIIGLLIIRNRKEKEYYVYEEDSEEE